MAYFAYILGSRFLVVQLTPHRSHFSHIVEEINYALAHLKVEIDDKTIWRDHALIL